MNKRIKELRKYLGLTLEKFGERLGVKKAAVSKWENGDNVTEQTLKSICREFNVNEDWLLNGNEPMFIQTDAFNLDEFMKQKGATELELEIVRTYFELDPETRKAVLEHFKNKLNSSANKKDSNNIVSSDKTTEELEKEYKKNVLHSAPKTDSIVSNITTDTGRKNKAVGEE